MAVEDDAGMVQVIDILQVELLCPFLVLCRHRGEQSIAYKPQRDDRHGDNHADSKKHSSPPAGGIAVHDYFFLGGTTLAAAVSRCLSRVLVVIEVIHARAK